jgi:transposase
MRNGGYRSQAAGTKAIITVAHAILVISWHVLSTGKTYEELGRDYFDRRADLERACPGTGDSHISPGTGTGL